MQAQKIERMTWHIVASISDESELVDGCWLSSKCVMSLSPWKLRWSKQDAGQDVGSSIHRNFKGLAWTIVYLQLSNFDTSTVPIVESDENALSYGCGSIANCSESGRSRKVSNWI